MRTPLAVLCIVAASAFAAEWQEQPRFLPYRVEGGGQNTRALAGLGTTVEMSQDQWPKLLRRTVPWQSIQRVPEERSKDWDRNKSLGLVRIDDAAPKAAKVTDLDWTFATAEWRSKAGKKLTVWVSRASPALLLHSDAEGIGFFVGKDAPQPRFYAREAEGKIKVASALDATEVSLGARSWLLVWFGSAFTSSRFSTYLAAPYPADCPMLFFFQNPATVSFERGMQATFAPGEVGNIATVPIFGDAYPLSRLDEKQLVQPFRSSWNSVMPADLRKYACPRAAATETWAEQLPDDVATACRWWAEHLREFPASVAESYRYDAASDTLTVTEKVNFTRVAEGGTPFAPLPPMLALAHEEGFPVKFSGPVVRTSVLTAHGPVAGLEGVREYTWQIAGLSRYVLAKRDATGKGKEPEELARELEQEVGKILDAGDLAPWYPVLDDDGAGYMGYYDRGFRGHFVFANPAETIYYLAEALPLLKPEVQTKVLAFVRELRAKHPPEKLGFLALGQGAPRERYRATPPEVLARLNSNFRSCNFHVALGLPPEKNLYFLARYYELADDRQELKAKWPEALGMLTAHLAALDWGTMGYVRRPVRWYGREGLGGVMDVNDLFAGLLGATRLARMAGDGEAEPMLWGLFGRVAALRFAMAKYPSYLYKNGLLRLPEQKDWMVRLLAGSWHGHLYTTNWTSPDDDVQQIWQMDQFGVQFCEDRLMAWPGLMAFLEPVPELGLFFKDHLVKESEALLRRVNEAMPAWWTVYCPCEQTWETNFQPPEDAHQLFLLSAWVLGERPERLAWLRDVPWLARGDLFYLQKLAETIRAYRRKQ